MFNCFNADFLKATPLESFIKAYVLIIGYKNLYFYIELSY